MELKSVRGGALRKPVVLITTGALLVAAGVALIVDKAVDDDQPGAIDRVALAHADRVLQSVQVDMSPDGQLTSVDGTVVGTTTDDHQFSGKQEYSPSTAADDLPVRVQASYRTPTKSGTDLTDLSGYDGPVQVQLTVQNLTVKPRVVTYDVDGTQRSRSALVGVPLTVVASARLPHVDPSAVRESSDDDLAPTNGVVSQDGDGATQVQWAAILAPPQLRPTTTLTLSLDAHDFQVPDIDLSVQPGLVTDTSVGALIDDAFNPSGSSQMDLEKRTIELVGQVNAVLARAGATIDRVRSTLDESARTLGTKTVSDLHSSASSITASVRGLDSSVTSLGRDLTTSLQGTRSTTVEQLQQIVQAVDQMLGDTSAKPRAPHLSGSGCDVTVPGVRDADSVYGNLLEVVGQLDGYARATDSCKDALRTSILRSVGPADPDPSSCAGSASVTCSLLGAKSRFDGIANDLLTAGNDAVAALQTDQVTQAVNYSGLLTTATGELKTAIDALSGAVGSGPGLGGVRGALQQARQAADGVAGALASVHQQALAGRDAATALGGVNGDLAGQICALRSSGDLSDAGARQLRSYVTSTDCDGQAAQPGPAGGPMDERIAAQAQAWSAVADATDASDTSTGIGQALAALGTTLDGVGSALDDLASASHSDDQALDGLYAALRGAFDKLDQANRELGKRVTGIQQQQQAVQQAVQDAFDQAAADTRSELSAAVDPQIRQITDHAATDSEALASMFDRSRAGLGEAAQAIQHKGATSIEHQRGAFKDRQQAAAEHISSSVEKGLSQISQGVSASTRDMKAANSLLIGDLHNVLLDLGTRQVKGSGLLGSMTTGAATAGTASYQLSLASRTATSYANVRRSDVAGMLLRQAQTEAAMRLQEQLPAFRLDLPDSATHRTVYSFHLRGGK